MIYHQYCITVDTNTVISACNNKYYWAIMIPSS